MATTDSPRATLFESLQQTLVAAAEIGGNRLLTYDDDALAACRELEGRIIEIEVIDLEFRLFCHPGSWGLRLTTNPPARDADARISGQLLALINLASQEDKLSTSIGERIRYDGDATLAQKLQHILVNLDIDWEEMLAEHTGDVLAVQIHQRARRFGDWLRQSVDSVLLTSSEYLREEARLSPTQTEFDRFQAEVTALKHDLARSEARLQRLFARLEDQDRDA